jgi:hypothetical protein
MLRAGENERQALAPDGRRDDSAFHTPCTEIVLSCWSRCETMFLPKFPMFLVVYQPLERLCAP